MKISPVFAWYDFWIGVYWDAAKWCLYILPIPTIGVKIQLCPQAAERATLEKRVATCHVFHKWERLERCSGRRHRFYDRCVRCGATKEQGSRRCGSGCPVSDPTLNTKAKQLAAFLEAESKL
jgi:hypothetical protein